MTDTTASPSPSKSAGEPVDDRPPKSKISSRESAAKSTQQTDFFRETVESVLIAFMLAFLFRTFVAEAFVIPTGSMATTLMGRHRDLECEKCRYPYQVSASSEVTDNGARKVDADGRPVTYVSETICPMCRWKMDTSDEKKHPSYKGDRIIVSKFGVGGPRRWDVIVFRYPEEAATNYIKRCVGLPNETLMIRNGDILVRPSGAADFEIARKPPQTMLAMLRDVYDNDYVVDSMTKNGWPTRWQACPMDLNSLLQAGWSPGNQRPWTEPPASPNGWTTDDGSRSFIANGKSDKPVWLRYQHFTPYPYDYPPHNMSWVKNDWKELKKGKIKYSPQPFFIADFIAYNEGFVTGAQYRNPNSNPAWVGDLALECELTPKSYQGEIVLELIEGLHFFRCRLDLEQRGVELSIDDGNHAFEGQGNEPGSNTVLAKQALPDGGPIRIMFSNVDNELRVWINGDLVEFDGATRFDLPIKQEEIRSQDIRSIKNFSPIGIASKGAAARVNHLRVLSDIYYRACDIDGRSVPPSKEPHYTLEKDQFFVLGDNSSKSKDARMWKKQQYVDRKLLIGKALFIYWPHSWDSPLPFTPNAKRMGFIR